MPAMERGANHSLRLHAVSDDVAAEHAAFSKPCQTGRDKRANGAAMAAAKLNLLAERAATSRRQHRQLKAYRRHLRRPECRHGP